MPIRFLNTTAVDTDVLYVDASSNNVGIGTTSPSTSLHIAADTPAIRLQDNTSSDNHYLNGNNGEFRIQTTGFLTLRPGNAESVRFLANGNVGIGTTSPAYPLEVNGIIKTSSSFLGTTAIVQKVTALDANGIQFTNNGGSEKMRITDVGNVGIGTTSPAEKLTVSGDANVTGKFAIGIAAVHPTIDFYNQGTAYFNGSTTVDDNLIVTNGNVGIGTTSPSAKLDIIDSGLSTMFRLSNTEANATTKYGAILGRHYTNAEENVTGMLITSNSSATGGTVSIGGGISAANAVNNILFYTAANNTTLVGTERMRINSSGDVGIGTTSPEQLLHLMKGTLTPAFTAPESEVLRVQSKAPSEISGNPDASDINIFTSRDGYARVIFTDDTVSYGENGVVMDFVANPPTLNLRTKANNTLICDYNASVYCGANHTLTSSSFTFAAGDGNNPSGPRSFAAGHLTEATGDISAAFGYDTLASGAASFATGALTTASGGNSFAAGGSTTASGGESAAFGVSTVASGEESFAIGNGTTASGASSFAGGGPTTLASSINSFAFGADVDVTGGHSAAFGRLHDVAGTENLVGGLSNTVNGDGNLVGGANNDLSTKDNNLVAGGSNAIISTAGNYNTMIGFSNEIGFGSYNLSGGQDTFNFGTRSISFGSGTTASKGNQQFAFGEGTTTPTTATAARASNQFVVGKFNDINNAVLFAVGKGSSTSFRQNALTVSATGYVGISTATPVYDLDVNGLSRFSNTLFYTTLTQISQGDRKKDIADIDKNKANTIPFKEYKYKEGDTERVRYGVIVEDIEDDYPELVYTGSDGVKGVSYIDLLIKRVAELEKELDDISLTPGPKGSTGSQGPTGATGPQGPAGNDGKNGSDATIPVLGCKDEEIGTFTSIKICEGSIYFNYVDGKGVKQEPIKCQIAK